MRIFLTVFWATLLVLLTVVTVVSESLYPEGSNVASSYELSASAMLLGDTLTISRSIVNSESFALTGLYFSENLPPEFEIVGHSLFIDGQPISYEFVLPLWNVIVGGYNCYSWIVDDVEGSTGNNVEPGETVTLEISIIPADTGAYLLPHHSAVFYGNGAGFFSTDSALSVSVNLSVDVDEPDHRDELLPEQHLTTRAYPNPFNGPVTIAYSGSGLTGQLLGIEIFNVLGQRIYGCTFPASSDRGTVVWEPSSSTGSGTYFYRLTSPIAHTGGKLLLIK